MDRGNCVATVHGVTEVGVTGWLSLAQHKNWIVTSPQVLMEGRFEICPCEECIHNAYGDSISSFENEE